MSGFDLFKISAIDLELRMSSRIGIIGHGDFWLSLNSLSISKRVRELAKCYYSFVYHYKSDNILFIDNQKTIEEC